MDDDRGSKTVAWRLQAYSLGVVAALAVGLVFVSFGAAGDDRPDADVGEDYPAFYGAGRIAADGDWDELWSFDRQVEAQASLQGEEHAGEARFFAYPPQVALLYRPLAELPYPASYAIHSLLMGAFLAAAVILARPMVPLLQGRVVPALAASLTFWPMLKSVTGGSNTALTALLVVAAWRLAHDDRDGAAGLVLSLLLFKPQFAIPLTGLFLLARRWRIVAGVAAGSALFYGLGALLVGPGWVGDWLRVASDFGRLDAEVNGFSAVSFVGFFENALGVGAPAAIAIGGGLAAATALGLSWLWLRSRGRPLDVLLAISMPGMVLLSLHAMSHDGAVVLVTLAVMAAHLGRRALPFLAAIWVVSVSQTWISSIGFSPGFFILLVVQWSAITSLGPLALEDRPPATRVAG
ncbi:MAG TPA: glycosyltransferase family 87 protein [Acidimicrobiia bacterium]